MPNLIPSIVKDLQDGNTDLYTNTSGGNALLKSLILEHKNTPGRLITLAGGAPTKNFISAAHCFEESQNNNGYAVANIGDNRIVIVGANFYQDWTNSNSNLWAQVLEYDSTLGAYFSYQVSELSATYGSGAVGDAVELVSLSPTKLVMWCNSTVTVLKVNADYTIEETGSFNVGSSFGSNISNLLTVYDVAGTNNIHQTKVIVSSYSGNSATVRALTVPDTGNPSWSSGSATTVVTVSNLQYSQACRATKLANKFFFGVYSATSNILTARSYAFDPATNGWTAISSETNIPLSYGINNLRCVSFSGGTVGGSVGDGTEFNAHAFGFRNNGSLGGWEFFFNSHSNDAALNTGVVGAGNTSWSGFTSNYARPLQLNDNCFSLAGGGGVYFVSRAGTAMNYSMGMYNGSGGYAVLFPFKGKPVFRSSAGTYAKYLVALSTITATITNPTVASAAPVYMPFGYQTNKTIKWHPTLNCFIAVNGSNYVYAINDSGVVTGYGEATNGSSGMLTCLDISPTGHVFIGGAMSASGVQYVDSSTSLYIGSGTINSTTGVSIWSNSATASSPAICRVANDIVCTGNTSAAVLYQTWDGSSTYSFQYGLWANATAFNSGQGTMSSGTTRLYYCPHLTAIYRGVGSEIRSVVPTWNGTATLAHYAGSSLQGTSAAHSNLFRRNVIVSCANSYLNSLIAAPGLNAQLFTRTTFSGSGAASYQSAAVVPLNTRAYAVVNDNGGAIAAYSVTQTAIPSASITVNLIKPDYTVESFVDACRWINFLSSMKLNSMKLALRTPNTLNETYEAFGSVTTAAYFYVIDGSGNSVKLAKDALSIAPGEVKKSSYPVVIPNNGKLRVNLDKKYQLDAYMTVLEGI